MRPKQHRIKLTLDERTELESVVKATSVSFEKRRRAKVLLLCDESEFGLGLEDAQVVFHSNLLFQFLIESLELRSDGLRLAQY